MDVVSTISNCLATWHKGGEAECRNVLFTPHCTPSDPECLRILITAYTSLVSSLLVSCASTHHLAVQELAEFVRGILDSLPSSSSSPPAPTDAASLFGENLIDIIWTIHAHIDELENYLVASAKVDEKAQSPTPSLGPAVAKFLETTKADKSKLQELVSKLLEYRILNVRSCLERLDTSILGGANLLRDKGNFEKKEVRIRTALFYKQNKFNLLREQSEGYSKLTTEITSSLGPPHSSQTGLPAEPAAVIESRARPVWEKVLSLIGHFDLDPNRALDVILDIMSTHLATHYSFFLALLSCLPWATHRRISSTKGEDGKTVDPRPPSYQGMTLEGILISKEERREDTGEQNRDGSRVLAQVLGFKFAHHRSAEREEPTPINLYLMTALLIREGFITLEDIYPHLSASDQEMKHEKDAYEKGLQARLKGGEKNALEMAAPLESGPSTAKQPTSTPVEAQKSPVKGQNQTVGLLKALLAVGCLRPALSIMAQYPWLVNPHPGIADLMLRVLRHSISSLYAQEVKMIPADRASSFRKPRARYGPSGLVQPAPPKQVLTLMAPVPSSTTSTEFVFFYPHWTDHVPTLHHLEEIEAVVMPLMAFIGPLISRDPVFMSSIARLGKKHLMDPENPTSIPKANPAKAAYHLWHKMLRVYLLPALSLARPNAVLAVEIGAIVRSYETEVRYQMYGEWRAGYSSHPELKLRAARADKEAKYIGRRLTVVKEIGQEQNGSDPLTGVVGKLAHSDPGILFGHLVSLVMQFSTSEATIQALGDVTNMGFDVLIYTILDAFSNPDKARLKDDGVNTSDWLTNLSDFIGMVFRRFNADLTPALKYIVHQLYNGQTSEILVLSRLIEQMVGIQRLPTLTRSQTRSMFGGPILRIQSIAASTRGALVVPGDQALKAPSRLGWALLQGGLGLPLLVQVAQQRQSCVFTAPSAPLKSLSSLFDDTHAVLLQYLECLTSTSVFEKDEYETKIMPKLEDMVEKYGIALPICMHIMRPVWHRKIKAKELRIAAEEKAKAKEDSKMTGANASKAAGEPEKVAEAITPDGQKENTPSMDNREAVLKEQLVALRAPHRASSAQSSSSAEKTPADPANAEAPTENPPTSTVEADTKDLATPMDVDSLPSAPVAAANTPTRSPWMPELEEFFDTLKRIAPASIAETIGPAFYLTFWQLSGYEITIPEDAYKAEREKLVHLINQADSDIRKAERSSDRATRTSVYKIRSRKSRYAEFKTALWTEEMEHYEIIVATKKRLAREKGSWFVNSTKAGTLVQAIIEHCIQPRCLISPMDAEFCAQFIRTLHLLGTPNFHTLLCYDKLLAEQVKVVIFSCTEKEAGNYAVFLHRILADMSKWHKDEKAYIEDNRITTKGGKALNLPGFQRVLNQRGASMEPIMTWPNFQQIMRKWHKKIAKCFVDCFKTGEYMHVRNAITVLVEILPVFPLPDVMAPIASELRAVIEQHVKIEGRQDLKTVCQGYVDILKSREHLWTGSKPMLKANGVALSSSTSQGSPAPERPRVAQAPAGPSSQPSAADNQRRDTPTNAPVPVLSTQPPASAPSGPRAAAANTSAKPTTTSQATRAAMDSVPRPELIKRVRTEGRGVDSPRPPVEAPSKPSAPLNGGPNIPPQDTRPIPVLMSGPPARDRDQRDAQQYQQHQQQPQNDPSRYQRGGPPQPPHYGLPNNPMKDARVHDSRGGRDEPHHANPMPPPSNPSQTAVAQEIRDGAKATAPNSSSSGERERERERDRGRGRDGERGYDWERERAYSKELPKRYYRAEQLGSQYQQQGATSSGGSGAPSPRVRSPSPTNPPTRDPSTDSRGSGGRMRSDRMVEGAGASEEGGRDSGKQEVSRDGAGGAGAGGANAGRRDSLTHTRERANRDRASERDRERDSERGRDRHGDRERDRGERDRERDRDSHRSDRERERDRDRHRRDDRERERKSGTSGGTGAADNAANRADAGRDSRRSAQGGDDSLGKRRRGTDDDSDRASKRSSRKERDDRSRRGPSDKDGNNLDRGRESDRRRKDREEATDKRNTDSRGSSRERPSDKRSGDGQRDGQRSDNQQRASGSGPTTSDNAANATSSDPVRNKAYAQPPPSAPRADRNRLSVPPKPAAGLSGGGPGGSLRSRISDSKEGGVTNTSNSNAPASSGPLPPPGSSESAASFRSTGAGSARGAAPSSRYGDNDDRDGSKKRTASEREKEVDAPPPAGDSSQSTKRPRIIRNRTQTGPGMNHGFARRTLPLDHGENRGRRQD